MKTIVEHEESVGVSEGAGDGNATSIQGITVNATVPLDAQALVYSGGQYVPTTIGGAISDTDGLTEGSTNLYFTNTRATDALIGHTGESTIHFVINDIGTTTTVVWSASKLTTILGTKADTSVLTAHTGESTIHFIMGDISITESQVSDLDKYTQVEVTNYLSGKADTGDIITAHGGLSDIGSNAHSAIDTHLGADAKHRLINDVGTTATELFSASKINTELAGKQAASLAEGSVWIGDGSSVPTATALTSLAITDAVHAHTTTTGAISLDRTNGITQTIALTGSPTFSVAGFTTGYAHNLILIASGLFGTTPVWPTGFKFENEVEPTWETGKTYAFNFFSIDGGTAGFIGVNGGFSWA